jgi:hypothetical protein
MLDTPPSPATASVCIARFNSLPETHVVEHWKFTVEEWLSWLEQKPTQSWKGTHKHPGWSPVLYEPPERAKENIKNVFGLVLDYDKGATWDAVAALWGEFYGTIYTTKSHDIDRHRLRVVLPLSRPVVADEYDKLWQWADQQARKRELKTDGQAKDASRFWYTPTLPDRGEWRAERLTGNVLDVDATLPLAEQPRLRAVTMPPVFTADMRVRRASAYLARIAPAVAGDAGHTATFNAVAHVMIGFDLDEATTYQLIASEYNPRCDPPWSERELHHKIRSVAERCTRERGYLLKDRQPVHTTEQASHHAPDVPDEHEVDWRTLLITGDKNKIKRGYNNVLAFVRHHPDYRGKWSLNTMTGDVWFDGRPMRDTFVHDIRAHADRLLGFSPGRDDVDAAIATSAAERPFHPIQQYLRSVDWDGTERLHAMARDFLGSNSELHAQLVRKWMISAVARALNPGCKVDTALMLHGEQGYFKSSFFTILGGNWHADSPIDIANKDSFAQIHAAWIYEFAELENVVTGRAESRLKAWLTSTHDMYRAPYARVVERRPRSCVICGTTNRKQFLTDDTGSRRFWIVSVTQEIPRELLAEMRDQLWAEAVCAYEAGETWWLDREAEVLREDANADYSDEDPWQETIENFLALPTANGETTIVTVLRDALKLDHSRQDRWAQMRVARILGALGWEKRRLGTERRYAYRRKL